MSYKSIAFSFMPGIGEFTLCVFVAGDKPYRPEDWALYIETLKRYAKSPLKTIVLTDGGSPNPVQRKEMAELFTGTAPPTCIVSSSQIVRGMTTALGWFNPNIKSVAPDELREAFRYLKIPTVHEDRVWKEVSRLRSELPDLKSVVRFR